MSVHRFVSQRGLREYLGRRMREALTSIDPGLVKPLAWRLASGLTRRVWEDRAQLEGLLDDRTAPPQATPATPGAPRPLLPSREQLATLALEQRQRALARYLRGRVRATLAELGHDAAEKLGGPVGDRLARRLWYGRATLREVLDDAATSWYDSEDLGLASNYKWRKFGAALRRRSALKPTIPHEEVNRRVEEYHRRLEEEERRGIKRKPAPPGRSFDL